MPRDNFSGFASTLNLDIVNGGLEMPAFLLSNITVPVKDAFTFLHPSRRPCIPPSHSCGG